MKGKKCRKVKEQKRWILIIASTLYQSMQCCGTYGNVCVYIYINIYHLILMNMLGRFLITYKFPLLFFLVPIATPWQILGLFFISYFSFFWLYIRGDRMLVEVFYIICDRRCWCQGRYLGMLKQVVFNLHPSHICQSCSHAISYPILIPKGM